MSEEITKIHLACAAEGNYLPHCAAMLQSAISQHAQGELIIHFLHGPELEEEKLRPLRHMVEKAGTSFVSHYIPPEWVQGLPTLKAIPAVMWYRLFLPDLLPEESRVLYLDCDTLVMEHLSSLWRTDLEEMYLGAVENVFEKEMQNWPQTLGMPQGRRYFNSGILLLNLDLIRRDDLSQKMIEFGRNPGVRKLRWPDQDALNMFLSGACRFLHPRWNCQNSFFYYQASRDLFGSESIDEAVRHPGILHFEGGDIVKPWHYLSKHPFREQYFSYRKQTAWPDVTLLGKTFVNRWLRLLPLHVTIRLYLIRARLRRSLLRLLK